jgi:hypothetical protein
MQPQLEEIQPSQIAGVPNGYLCIAEDAYNPAGLMQDMCNAIQQLNTIIDQTYPGVYDSEASLTVQDIEIKIRMKCVGLFQNGQNIGSIPGITNANTTTIVIKPNPNYDPQDATSPTHQIMGNPKIPIILNCDQVAEYEQEIIDSYKEIMKIARQRVENFYKEKFRYERRNIIIAFEGQRQFIGNKTVDLNRRRIIIDQGIGQVPIISRPFFRQEAPSLFPQ